MGTYVLHLGIPRTTRLTHARAHRAVRVGLKKQGIQVPHTRSATGGTLPPEGQGVAPVHPPPRDVIHIRHLSERAMACTLHQLLLPPILVRQLRLPAYGTLGGRFFGGIHGGSVLGGCPFGGGRHNEHKKDKQTSDATTRIPRSPGVLGAPSARGSSKRRLPSQFFFLCSIVAVNKG